MIIGALETSSLQRLNKEDEKKIELCHFEKKERTEKELSFCRVGNNDLKMVKEIDK